MLVGLADLPRLRGSARRLRVVLPRSPSSPSPRLRLLAFQAADIYQVQAFRGYEKQYFRLASAWSVVFLIVIGIVVLRQGRRPVLARLARQLLCRRAARADRLPPRAVPPGAALDPQGRLDRRAVVVGGGEKRRGADQGAPAQTRFRRPRRRRVRRPRRRALAHSGLRAPQARHRRRPRRVRPPHPHRSRDLLAADLGGGAHPADAQEAVGAAGRHPPRRACQQAALPPARLFLHRQRPGARRRSTSRSRTGTS